MEITCSALPLSSGVEAGADAAARESEGSKRAPAEAVRNSRRFIRQAKWVESGKPDVLAGIDHAPHEILEDLAPRGTQTRIGGRPGVGTLLHLDLDRVGLGLEMVAPRHD